LEGKKPHFIASKRGGGTEKGRGRGGKIIGVGKGGRPCRYPGFGLRRNEANGLKREKEKEKDHGRDKS